MKKRTKIILIIVILIILCASFVFSGGMPENGDLWENAVYTEDTELGSGEKTVTVEVVAKDRFVTFTLNTDKETLEDALSEYDLISGEDGPYGLYVKKVNGILADYDENQSYWSLTRNGEYLETGVSDTKITDGEHYELTYIK
ncbi:MAG: DUF4430 domain-containing protein [Clostridia bacterium]|nr:DUF4430 domain-containing protein [Clostridia bacterium]